MKVFLEGWGVGITSIQAALARARLSGSVVSRTVAMRLSAAVILSVVVAVGIPPTAAAGSAHREENGSIQTLSRFGTLTTRSNAKPEAFRRPEAVPGEILVRYRTGAARAAQADTLVASRVAAV